jgi:uncharacterized membrane protein YfcA
VDLSWELVCLCLAALVAGAVNSIAGGGTLLTFPALLAGLSYLGAADAAVVANATSTAALVPGSLAGAWGYRREMQRARRWLYLLVGLSLAGGVIGALLVTRLDSAYFAALVPWLLLTAALLFLAEALLPKKAAADSGQRRPSACVKLRKCNLGVSVIVGGRHSARRARPHAGIPASCLPARTSSATPWCVQ